jgi:hypothetical protein
MSGMTTVVKPVAPPAEPTAPAVAGANSRFKRALIVLAAMVASAGIAYLVGRLQTAGLIHTAEAQTQQAVEAKSSAERALLRLEARRRLHLCVVALDQRNFGIAEQHLSLAARLLASSKPEGELEALRARIAGLKLPATDNVGEERKQVLDFAAKLDELVPPAEPK